MDKKSWVEVLLLVPEDQIGKAEYKLLVEEETAAR
jgi:hypothetical protein